MKIFSALTIVLLIIFQAISFAATGTFSASGEYLMSDYDTPEIAEEIALDFAKQNAAEQAGVYLESYSRTENFELADDEIKTVANSKVEVLTKNITRQSQSNGRILLRADITASVDTSALDNFLSQEREQRQQAIQRYKELQAMNEQIKKDLDALQTKLAAIKAEVADDDLLVEQERINREFLSKQALDRMNLQKAVKIDPKNLRMYAYQSFLVKSNVEKLKAVDKSLALNPNYGLAYMYRGEYYQNLGEINENREMYALAVKNYNKAIELKSADEMDQLFFFNEGWLYLKLADSYKEIGDYDNAVENYLHVMNLLNNKDYGTYISLATTALKSLCSERLKTYKEPEDYAKAIEIYTRIIKLEPTADNYDSRGEIYMKIKNYDNALKDFEQSIKLDRKAASAYGSRADLYMAQKKYDKAIADYDRAIKLEDWASLRAYYLDDKQNAIKAKEADNKIKTQLKDIAPTDKEKLRARAKAYQELEDYELAIKDYTRLTKLDASDAEAYSGRGVCYTFLKDYARALEDFNQAIRLNPTNISYYIERADCYSKLNNYEQAIADCDKITELDPNALNTYNTRSSFYLKMGDYDKAIEEADTAYKLETDEDLKHTRLRAKTVAIIARADFYLKQGYYDKAVADYDTAFKITDDSDSLFKNKYLAFRRNALYAKTKDIRYLDPPVRYAGFSSQKDKTEFKNALFHQGDSYRKAEEYALAVENYTVVINVDEKNERAYYWRAWCYDELGDNEKALADLNRLLALNPNYDSNAYNNRAVAYENLGDLEKALADYNKALELDPNNESAKNNRQLLLDKMNK
ncbi:MAG: tetratricopeptide repeat protein [Quinella sp. 3Q1]|nr:tetratricopeptide repeat protein [Quinella sp. 3Q1]